MIVSTEDLERAQERVAEYYMEIHPELRASNELVSQGKCPACGSAVGADDNECSDCGLTLVIIEEENQEEEGGAAKSQPKVSGANPLISVSFPVFSLLLWGLRWIFSYPGQQKYWKLAFYH